MDKFQDSENEASASLRTDQRKIPAPAKQAIGSP
jgi:hypothetical protein